MLAIVIVVTIGAALVLGKVNAQDFIAVISIIIAFVTGQFAITLALNNRKLKSEIDRLGGT